MIKAIKRRLRFRKKIYSLFSIDKYNVHETPREEAVGFRGVYCNRRYCSILEFGERPLFADNLVSARSFRCCLDFLL